MKSLATWAYLPWVRASDGLRWPQRLNVTVILAGGYSQEEEK
jgi:hypothetical protein